MSRTGKSLKVSTPETGTQWPLSPNNQPEQPGGAGAPDGDAQPPGRKSGRSRGGPIISQLPVAVYVLQGDKIASVNQAAVELFGRSAAELLQINFWELVEPSLQPAVRERVRGWLDGEPLEFHGVTPIVTGRRERRWIEVFRRRTEVDGVATLLVVALELTERLSWIENTKRQIQRYEGLLGFETNAASVESRDHAHGPGRDRDHEPEGKLLRSLTRRQQQVLELIASGRSNKRIARELGITEGTVKLHVFSLMRNFQVPNRTMLALLAHANPLKSGN